MDSILNSIKKLLGILTDDISFDEEIILHINSVLITLMQLGVGPVTGYRITGSTETWSDFLGSVTNLEFAKSYVYLKVRLMFDPPSSSFVLEAMKNSASEFEFRLMIQAEANLPVVVEEVLDEG